MFHYRLLKGKSKGKQFLVLPILLILILGSTVHGPMDEILKDADAVLE